MATVAALLTLAKSQLGQHENPAGSNDCKFTRWYGLVGQPWCAQYVSWVFTFAGVPLPAIDSPKGFHYTPDAVNWAKAHGMWDASGRYAPGDIVLYTWGGRSDGAGHYLAQHTGIVVADNGSYLTAVEGNVGAYGGSVELHVRAHGWQVLGVLKASRWLAAAPPPKPPPTPIRPYTGSTITAAESYYRMV